MTAHATRNESIEAALKVDGWMTPMEASVLYDLASMADGPIVEIGSWHGRSTSALALGSMAGRKQPVYAIDPFIGPQAKARLTSLGNKGETLPCSPEILRANLDAAGVNGLVKILPKKSQDALEDIPAECGMLFIDGAHDYGSVCRDFDNYLPRLKTGGMLVVHDVTVEDPDVLRAVKEKIRSRPLEYRVMDQVDSALVVRKVNTVSRGINLACPGGNFTWGMVCGIAQASLGAHRVDLDNNGNGFDDFNALWARALNRAETGEITHFAMLHSDVAPMPGWLDILLDECEELHADLVSVAIPIKDMRGVMSCGWGDLEDRWGSFRRLTVNECLKMPPTFGEEGSPYPDKVLLHNTGCWIADLRSPVFTKTDEDGRLIAWFDFPTDIVRDNGKWVARRESEDWFFSRQLHVLEARTFITRKVRLAHRGVVDFRNDSAWGSYQNGDEDSAKNWRKKEEAK